MTYSEAIQALEEAVDTREAAEAAITAAVLAAKNEGATWGVIAATLGVTKQRAHQKYAAVATAPDFAAAIIESNAASKKAHEESKILDTDVAGNSVTPSIFLDPIAPAPAPAKAKTTRTRDPRPFFRLPERQPQHAVPGTGKGPHQCPTCGENNHKNGQWQEVAMYPGCIPTKYDTPAITAYMKEHTK